MTEPMSNMRFVEVTFAVPGLSPMIEVYDRLSLDDMVCWRLNTAPPAMCLSVVPKPERGEADCTALEQVSRAAREEATRVRKLRDK